MIKGPRGVAMVHDWVECTGGSCMMPCFERPCASPEAGPVAGPAPRAVFPLPSPTRVQAEEVRQLVRVGQEAFLTQLLDIGFFHG